MKRTLLLILLGAAALPASLPADMPPPANAPGVATQPTENVVENGAPRGPLGSLASGAPSVAEKLPAPAAAAPAAGGAPAVAGAPASGGPAVAGAAAPAPAAGAAVAPATSSVATVQQTAVVGQQVSKMPHEILVMEAMGHCFFDAMQQFHKGGMAPIRVGGGFPFLPPAGDLRLISVQQVGSPPGEPPLYRITFKNHSRFVAENFRVSIIASNGRIHPNSPVVSTEIPELAADAIANVDLRVPAAALTLGPANAPGAFDTLVVVLDSLNVLAETNEWNNVAQFVRTEIVTVEVTETATAAPAAAAVAPATPATAVGPAAPAAPSTGPMTPPPAAAPNPGNGNGNQVPLEEIDEAASLLSK